MSHPENTKFLEEMKSQFEQAESAGDYAKMEDIIARLNMDGFNEEGRKFQDVLDLYQEDV